MGRVVRIVSSGVLILLLAAGHVAAQANTAQINGTVVDPSGGVLPGATVTAIQTDTGFRREVVSDEQGSFALTNLPIGPYRLEVALSGFRSYQQTGIVLQVGSNPVIPVTLQLGELAETVSVEAAAPLVETRTAAIGGVIDNERIEELPLNGRNSADLIELAGPTVRTEVSSSRSVQGTAGGVGYSVAGGQSFGVAYLLDGAIHNNPYDNFNLPLPFPDALQEFRVETSAQNAQNGFHSGASVNAVTKSGTNLFHADLFEFFRHHRFNATNPFNAVDPVTGKRRDDGLKRHQFGGTLGGPVVNDRIFFFGAYQGTRIEERPSDDIRFVPTPAMLAGDFTQIASAACNTRGALTLPAPFVGNRIEPSLLSPAAVQIARQLPVTSDPCGRVNVTNPRSIEELQAIGKMDVQLNQNHALFGRYMATTYVYEPPFGESQNILSTRLGGRDNLVQSATGGDTLVLSNSVVNNARFAVNRSAVHRTHTNFFDVKDVGINTYSYLEDYMLLAVTGAFNLGGGTESESRFTTNSYTLNDDLTVVRGNHQWGFGVAYAWWDSLSKANVRSPGTFTFDGGATGNALADFMVGRLQTFVQSAPNTLNIKQKYFGFYSQDTWRLSSRVTLNYGLRWEPWFPQQHRNDAVYNFSPELFRQGLRSRVFPQAPPGFTYPGDEGFPGHSGMDPDWLNFAPRAGVAWDVNGDGRTSVRTGYAMNGEFVNGQFFINAANAPPWGSEVRLTRPGIGPFEDPFRASGVTNPFPITFDASAPFSPYGPFISTPRDLDTTRVHSWNASIQRQIGNNTAVSASYIGNYTANLWDVVVGNPGTIPGGSPTGPCTLRTTTGPQTFANCSQAPLDVRREISQLDPAVGQYIGYLDFFTDTGHQQYHGLLIQVQRRATNGLSAGGVYTLSKCEGHPSGGGGTANVASGYTRPISIINPPSDEEIQNRLDLDYGPCNTDRRHIFTVNGTIQSPEFGGRMVRVIASNWRLSGVFRAASGRPITVLAGVDRALTGQQTPGVQRPDQVLDDPYGSRTFNNWFNPQAFAQPALGTFGSARRNAYESMGSRSVDLSLVRAFRFGDTHRIEARIEAFNALNWFRPAPQASPEANNAPVNNLANANFGRYLAADEPRIMQFAVKYQF
jgi:carboxypeptidase family protein